MLLFGERTNFSRYCMCCSVLHDSTLYDSYFFLLSRYALNEIRRYESIAFSFQNPVKRRTVLGVRRALCRRTGNLCASVQQIVLRLLNLSAAPTTWPTPTIAIYGRPAASREKLHGWRIRAPVVSTIPIYSLLFRRSLKFPNKRIEYWEKFDRK